MIHP
jgi:hypothetical protein